MAAAAGVAAALAVAVPAASASAGYDALPAFPGAEGFGYAATGGRGGEVYHVTSKELTGPGTFHDALTTAGDMPRTIVFEIAGDVTIPQIVARDKHGITIAGQTAPGDGVTIRGNTVRFVESSDIVIRNMRFRLGSASTDDAMYIEDSQDVIVDHSSFSWAGDEVLSIKSKDYDDPRSKNITVQWSIMSEGRLTHSMGGLVEMNTISMHHNLYAHNNDRNPKTKGVMDFVNNVVYNWGDFPYVAGGESGTKGYGNVVGNYFVAGVNSANPTAAVVRGNENYQVFLDDNRIDSNRDGVLNGRDTGSGMIEAARPAVRVPERFEYPPVHTQSPRRALDLTLDHAGASVARDAVDARVVDEVRHQTGAIIGDESDVGGYPELDEGTPATDADRDGMADDWELARGLDPTDPEDRNGDDDGDRYTNLEEYLNELAAPGFPKGYPLTPVPWSGDAFEPPAPEAPEAAPTAPMEGDAIRSAVVTDSSSNGAANAALWSIEQDLRVGDFVAGDRTTGSKAYRFTAVPPEIQGLEWVRSAVESRAATNDDLLSFYLPVDADVWVAHDTRVSPRPAWLTDGYEATDLTVADDHGGSWNLFKARFPAGSHVVTGANAGGTVLNYFVAVDPVPGGAEPVATAPGEVRAEPSGPSGDPAVELSWTGSAGATGYLVARTSSSEPGTRVVGTSAGTTFRDAGVEAGVPYRYQVTAVGPGGASDASAEVRALVTSGSTTAPAPGDLAVAAERSYSVDLAWSDVEGATAYGVYRAPAGGALELLDHVAGPGYTDDTAEPSTSYRYAVTTVSPGGESEPSADVAATTSGPLDPVVAPGQVRATEVSAAAFTLDWAPVPGAETYQVYRRDGGGAFARVGTTTAPGYTDDTISASVASYDYAVTAVNELGESGRSESLTVPLPVPAPPTDLRVGLQGSTSTGLVWTSGGGATEYRVLRSAAGGEPQEVGVAKVHTTYDRGLEPGTAYTYRVVAVNAAGTSEPSAPLLARTLPGSS
ncbi:fibronectin type III domain-containing protein [Isoptericola sp. NPDC056578]|uniref:fibronectin type III domain-containing protein n=1 Tax=Isoptericola sp. NPDC056578 TaxID=3345870 RepID=UPI0036ABBE0B